MNDKIDIKLMFNEGLKLSIPFILSILMSMVLLLPTAYTLLSGRSSGSEIVSLKSLFIPQRDLLYLLYDPYSLGLTVISLVAIIYLILKKRRKMFF